MSLLRVVVSIAVVVFCAGFIPVGGCAKGCGTAGRAASHGGDDIARLGVRTGDDLAVSGSRFGAVGVAGEGAGVTGARYADDIAVTGSHVADDVARDMHVTSIADELETSGIKLTERQHDELTDALKDVGQEVIGQLADGDDSDDDEDEARAAAKLDKRLQKTLTREQRQKFHAEFGTSREIVERLAREQQAKPAAGTAKK